MAVPLGLLLGNFNVVSLLGGRKAVTSSGTRAQLISSETPCSAVIIQALPGNNGFIHIGDSNLTITAGSENGIQIGPGAYIIMETNNPTIIYIDADQSNDAVSYLLLRG